MANLLAIFIIHVTFFLALGECRRWEHILNLRRQMLSKKYKNKFNPYYIERSHELIKSIKQESKWAKDTTKIREKYEMVRDISKPALYGFTASEADKFENTIKESISSRGKCRSRLPKYTDFKIAELYEILKNAKCQDHNKPTVTNDRRRKRRSLGRRIIQNKDGSVTRILHCLRRGDLTHNGNIRLCTQCHAVTELPSNRFPRFINEVMCDPAASNCLSRTGVCSEGAIKIPFLKDANHVGERRLSEWQSYHQTIRTSCSCEVLPDSPLKYFV